MNFLFLFTGVCLILFTLHDVFQSVVMPRWSGKLLRFAPFFTSVFWALWKQLAPSDRNRKTLQKRENWLGTFGPLCLILILIGWVGMLIVGFALCFWSVRAQIQPSPDSFFETIYLAGITLLTVGYGEMVPRGSLSRAISVAAGASGMAIFALVVSLFFTLYGAFERRETLVLALDSRAGSPPSGLAILENYAELELLDTLPDWFERWEEWSAQLLHSHIAYPLLPYFRSSHGGESWIAALGANLDAATLLISTVRVGHGCKLSDLGAAHLFFRLGSHAVLDLARWFDVGLKENDDPGVEREAFDWARVQLEKSGFELRDAEESWAVFSQKRAVYAHDLDALAAHFAVAGVAWEKDDAMLDSAHELPVEAKTLAPKNCDLQASNNGRDS